MDKEKLELFIRLVKQNGYSVTKPRQLVFEALSGSREPKSMHELYEELRGRIDRASLYRAIALYEQIGVVHRVPLGWKYKIELTDIFTHHHHHISCIKCGKIIPISEDGAVEKFIKLIAARHHVVPVSHLLEIQGYCRDCRSVV